jgi:hypothetical protein
LLPATLFTPLIYHCMGLHIGFVERLHFRSLRTQSGRECCRLGTRDYSLGRRICKVTALATPFGLSGGQMQTFACSSADLTGQSRILFACAAIEQVTAVGTKHERAYRSHGLDRGTVQCVARAAFVMSSEKSARNDLADM